MANEERSNWRDERLSKRHRSWGNLPMVNLDAIVTHETIIDEGTNSVYAEIWNRRPVLLVDYKAYRPTPIDWKHPTNDCLVWMADQCKCAMAVVFYSPNLWWFCVDAGNDIAKRVYGGRHFMTEFEYVSSLYQLRGVNMPSNIARNLRNDRSWERAS